MNLRERITENYSVAAVFVIYLIATSGSLFFSEVIGLYPCEYCWYQRILMYPIVVMSAYGLYKTRFDTGLYIFFAGAGWVIAAYHSYIQRIPSDGLCDTGCSVIVYTVGPLSIPNLSLIAFTLIIGVILYDYTR